MYNTELDKRLESWLKDQGIDPAMVSTEYSVERRHGMTMLNLKLYAPDFMEREDSEPAPMHFWDGSKGDCVMECGETTTTLGGSALRWSSRRNETTCSDCKNAFAQR
jgi:hypothetical protein